MSKRYSDDEILTAFLSTHSETETAKVLGCTLATISTRMKKPAFMAKLNDARKRSLENAVQNLCEASEKASNVLIDLLNSDSDFFRFNSAVKILELAKSYVTLEDLQIQVTQLEAKIDTDYSPVADDMVIDDDF